ncbi:multidrug effflux MFS transporter [Corynebacterium crudilactis]|uniref:Bcr/CflA family drug resistance efflux transporter n=1 Tax=Corynebacterium crudilactis TaxID=1652495 RepID=A0A172QW88_9CORY|nr:multidrug effflux MFS transporter [Corynebacterium crudilactis]ANE04916.1 Bcr/CflA family drug resistance efflux transporter [Corynebacterium crudilactis]
MQKNQQLSTTLIMGLALLSASSALATDMYLPALPGISQDLGTTAASVQLTLSSFMAGMAVGQLIIGPLSDQLGRKGFLVAGAVAALLASVVCAMAPSISILVLARLVQGLGGGACVVIARAIVPDLARGQVAAQAFALLMIIQGVAPVVAPLIGGVLVGPFGWRGIFWALALVNLAQLLVALLLVKESKPVEERTVAGLKGMLSNYRFVLSNPQFLAYVFTLSLAFGAMFSYISASPFVLQNQMGISVLAYSVIFGVNACGLIIGGMINRRLLLRLHPHRIMQTVLISFTVLCVILLVEVLFIQWSPLFLALLFLIVSHIPMIMANATALGVGVVRSRAGSGSAILGFMQFSMGALVSPLMGLGADKAVTMAVSMVCCALLASGCAFLAGRKGMPEMG